MRVTTKGGASARPVARAYLATRAPPTGLLGAGRAIVGADPRGITVLIPAEDTSGRAEK